MMFLKSLSTLDKTMVLVLEFLVGVWELGFINKNSGDHPFSS
jgi:hypothetical protein